MILQIDSLIFQSIFINLISSLLFLFVLLILLRPNLKISEEIAKELNQNGEALYVIKIINKSLFNAFDIDVNIDSRVLHQVRGGLIDEDLGEIPIFKKHYSTIPRFKYYDKSNVNAYAFQILIRNVDLDSLLKSNQQGILFQVTLRHGLTGIARSYEFCYVKGTIISGRFKSGDNLEIMN